MLYIPFIIIIVFGACLFFKEKDQIQLIKKNGVRVVGTIVENNGSNNNPNNFYRLGGNINNPTIQFTTKDGKEIIGQPAIGFASQFEVAVPSDVYIIYSSKDPEKFCVDIS